MISEHGIFVDADHPEFENVALVARWERRPYDYNKLAVALREASLETLLEVLPLICRVLKEQNPRFNEGMFMGWALEGK